MKHLIVPAISALLLAGVPAQAQYVHQHSILVAENAAGSDQMRRDSSGGGGQSGDQQGTDNSKGSKDTGGKNRSDKGGSQGGAATGGAATGAPASIGGRGQRGAGGGTTTGGGQMGGAVTTGGGQMGGAALSNRTVRDRSTKTGTQSSGQMGGAVTTGGGQMGGAALSNRTVRDRSTKTGTKGGGPSGGAVTTGGTQGVFGTGRNQMGGSTVTGSGRTGAMTFGTRPPNWNRYPRQFDTNAYQRNFSAPRSFHWHSYNRPSGWYYQRWVFGQIFPRMFWAQDYWLNDYWMFDLPIPPYGYVWVRYGDDALLINRRDGRVLQVVYGVFD